MKKVAILIDGGWFSKALQGAFTGAKPPIYPKHGITADIIYRNALNTIVVADEEITKVFYYDSEPYADEEKNPLSGIVTDYSKSAGYTSRKRLFKELGERDFVALRRGDVRPRGWTLTPDYLEKLMKGHKPTPLTDSDIYLNFEQKGVDMRIGIDVASLSLKKQVDRIILISGDRDMIPAIKLARREGVQVVLVNIPGRKLNHELIEDADLLRQLTPTL